MPSRSRRPVGPRRLAGAVAALVAVAPGLPAAAGPPARHHRDSAHGHDATVRHRFDDVERWSAIFDDPERAAWQKPAELIAWLGVAPGDVVVDLGAGTGYFTIPLARAVAPGGRVLALDVEASLVAHIAERARRAGATGVEARVVPPDDPLLEPASADRILVVDTWHHIDDRLAYLARLARALRPDGELVIVDFRAGELPVGPPAGHKMSRDAVVAELAEAGWRLTREWTALPYQYVLAFRPR